jgi:hypothetical protein
VEEKLAEAEEAVRPLEERLRRVRSPVTTQQMDALLDRVNSIRRTIAGRLEDGDVPALQIRLREVFEEFRVERTGDRVVVHPKLRPEFGAARRLDGAGLRQCRRGGRGGRGLRRSRDAPHRPDAATQLR